MASDLLKFIAEYNELKKYADLNSPEFSERLCKFFIQQFNLRTSVLFRVHDDGKLIVLGRAGGVNRSFVPEAEIQSVLCEKLDTSVPANSFFTDPECVINSSDDTIYEGFIFIKTVSQEKYLLLITQDSPFLDSDHDHYGMIGKFLVPLFETWQGDSGKGTISVASLITEIASELKTPPNNIIGFTSLLKDEELKASVQNHVNSIRNSSQKLLSLITNITEFARIESGDIENVPVSIYIKNFFDELKEEVDKEYSGDRKIKFDIDIDDELDKQITINAKKLKKIFHQVIGFITEPEKGNELSFQTAAIGSDKIEFVINNPSLVLSQEQLRQMTAPHTLIGSSRQINTASVLSLILMQKLIYFLNGEIEITSSAEKGTAITLTIIPGSVSPIEAQIMQLPKDGDKNKVLVIESDYATSKLLSNYLNKWGYQPTTVNSGKKALDHLEDEKYLAIITDINLPDVNGLELLKEIREIKEAKHTPVIVCSVESEKQKAYMLGAVEYFVKPIRYKDLVEVLTNFKLKKDSNILCVDDDEDTLMLVSEAIESVGYNAVSESHSSRVMELISDKEIDLAIIDLDMPEINGFDLIKMIKSQPRFRNLPIIIYTGKESYRDELEKIDGLFSHLLEKQSTKLEDLADTINNMVNMYEESTAPEESAAKEGVPRILLVEDYKHSQIIVTRLLKKNNFTSVVVVENGAEAVEQVKKQPFDLILMDMQMPVMNGFEATEKIREMPEYKETPIIALTAFAMKGDKEKCLEAGATDYIPKPIDSHDFIEKVKYYTSKS